MKTKFFLLTALSAMFFFVSCKKDSAAKPVVTISNNAVEGTATAGGDYTLTGHISSSVRLDKVVLTKEGQVTSFFIDESTAKNKNEYDFSYLITGITANTYILIDVYDQAGGKITLRFLIKK
jgi:hypothetical protein